MTDQRATIRTVRLLPLGDAAITVEFGNTIDPALNARVLAFAEHVRGKNWDGVLDVVPTYRSATIHLDPLKLDVTTLSDRLMRLTQRATEPSASAGTLHRIPLLYGGEWGPDLEDLAAFAKMSVTDVVRLHSSVSYRVYMLGFSPGFPYLGIVPEPLMMPRLATPRLTVPAGSVGIAGNQTGIYPTATPGGWRLIGRTPISLYRPSSGNPFVLSPGDSVRFEPIGQRKFERLLRERDADKY